LPIDSKRLAVLPFVNIKLASFLLLTSFSHLLKIAKAVDEEVVSRDLVPAFVKLLKDNEAEVRTAIAGQIPGFCGLIDQQTLLNDIMGSVEDLVSDTSQHVRAALGTQISGLAPILGKQEYVMIRAMGSNDELTQAL
jgi:hypothetical protein